MQFDGAYENTRRLHSNKSTEQSPSFILGLVRPRPVIDAKQGGETPPISSC